MRRAILLLAAAWMPLCAWELGPEQRKLNLESFDYIWKTIHDRHWDPKYNGADWDGARAELRPRLEKAATMLEAREIMSEMIGRLKQSHFSLIPAEAYSAISTAQVIHEGQPGIDVRVIGGQAVVSRVDPDSPAARGGVRLGWVIRESGGRAVQPVIEKIEGAPGLPTTKPLLEARSVLAMLSGSIGDRIKVRFEDGGGATAGRELELVGPRGQATRFGNMPPVFVWTESKRVAPETGYVRFNLFMDPVRLAPAFNDAVESCLECAGFVIDLRGNPGGIGAMSMGMAGWFFDKPGLELGTLFFRDSNLKFVVIPRARTFQGKLAILVDALSASTSEIFAGGLKDLGRARIFGERTAAAALPSIFDRLPNGDGFQYAIANYVSEGGKALEGVGVVPDVVAPLTREALLAGRDPALDAALLWIRSSTKVQ